MKVLGFDIDETTGRSACGTVRVCMPRGVTRTGYHVHVTVGPVSLQGDGNTLALAEGRASIEIATVAEASAKLVAMCPPWPDDFPLCDYCQKQEAEPDMMWCTDCIQRRSVGGYWVSSPSENA